MSPGSRYPPLPEGFLFGVGTSDHQTEAYDDRWPDIWDMWEQEVGLTARGRATEFWTRFPEDIALARGLGCRAFRFSVSWARVEPRPGEWNTEALDHYAEVVEAIRNAGMEPVLTLHHFTWPVHVHERGGMLDPGFPELFRAYARAVAVRLSGLVKYWITLNEPTMLPFGYIKPWWHRQYSLPPGQENASAGEQADAVVRLIRVLFQSHAAARREIRKVDPQALVGANPFVLGLPGPLQRFLDWRLTRFKSHADWQKGQHRAAWPALPGAAVPSLVSADVLLATTALSTARDQKVLMTEPYFEAHPVLVVTAKSAYRHAAELAGKRVAVVRGSPAADHLRRLIPTAVPVLVRRETSALRRLRQDRVAAVLGDDLVVSGLAAREGSRYRTIATDLPPDRFAAAVAVADPDLLEAVDAAIRKFKQSGGWAEAFARHFPGIEVPAPPHASTRNTLHRNTAGEWPSAAELGGPRQPATSPLRTDSALAAIRRRGRIRIAVRQDVPGFGEREPNTGELRGFEVDLARAIADHILGDPDTLSLHGTGGQNAIRQVRSPLQALVEPLLKFYSVTAPLFNSNWWHLGMAGKLPEHLCPADCVGEQDFVGLDYYWGAGAFRVDGFRRVLDALDRRFSQAPVWAGGLYELLKYYDELFPGQEILVVENGCVDRANSTLTGGVERAEYLRRHVRQLQRASRDGIRIAGYICWSLTTNREWGLPADRDSDFGLYHVDLDHDPDLKRVPTEAAEIYRQIIAKRSAG